MAVGFGVGVAVGVGEGVAVAVGVGTGVAVGVGVSAGSGMDQEVGGSSETDGVATMYRTSVGIDSSRVPASARRQAIIKIANATIRNVAYPIVSNRSH